VQGREVLSAVTAHRVHVGWGWEGQQWTLHFQINPTRPAYNLPDSTFVLVIPSYSICMFDFIAKMCNARLKICSLT